MTSIKLIKKHLGLTLLSLTVSVFVTTALTSEAISAETDEEEMAKHALEAVTNSDVAESFQAELYLEQAQATYEFQNYKRTLKLAKRAITDTAADAIAAAKAAGGNTFQPELFLEQSEAAFDLGDYKKAVKLAKKAVKNTPTPEQLQAETALGSVANGKVANSFQAKLYLEQAEATFAGGNFQRTMKLLKKAIHDSAADAIVEAKSKGSNTFQAELFLEQSMAAYDGGSYEKAVKLGRKAEARALK